ncbi:kelch-like protein 24 [Saccostrea echinata]|uniref:kelch-like protein 24 n=1 Tax=Saccostrea echinata TaxID=191078 RepID=UPI002A7EDD3F|nr:kelch-like protein 24 [Saccostrea echinata]
MSGKFDMREDYVNTFFSGLKRLWINGDHTDVTIQVQKETFHCHKTVLATMSSYFDSMFGSGMRECVTGTVNIEDMNPSAFKKALDFIYTGEIDLDVESAITLLHTSAFLQIKSLQKLCETYLKPHVNVENCIHLWKVSVLHNCHTIRATAFRKILDAFSEISKSEEFYRLDEKEILEIISQENLNISSEEDLCAIIFDWLTQNNNKGNIVKLLQEVRLAFVRPEFLVKIELKPEIKENPECLEIINYVKYYHLLPARQHEMANKAMRLRATSRQENVIVVLGGCEATKPPYTRTTSTYCYSFHQQTWFKLAPLPYDPGIEFAAVTYHNDIYITGGGMKQNSFLWYNVTQNVWSELPSLINGRRRHASVAVTDAIYVLGGYDSDGGAGNQMLKSVEKFIISERRWEQDGELVLALSCFAAIVRNDKIYTFGGEENTRTDTSAIQCYDMKTKTSVLLTVKIPMACKLTRSCVFNDRMILIIYDGRIIEYFEETETSKASCKFVTRFDHFQRTHFGVVEHNGNVVIVGGVIENKKPCKDFLQFDSNSMKCSVLDDVLFTPRLVDGCVKINIAKDHLVPLNVDSSC